MTLDHLKDLYLEELRDVYDAEKQLTKALPRMSKTSSNSALTKAFDSHLRQTEEHIQRIEKIFQQLGTKAKGKTCKAMKGLVEEGKDMMKESGEDDVRDAGLIAAAQRVEHYEIAAYGTLCAYAEMLGRKDDLKLLQRTLKEEKDTDKKLTDLAMKTVNPSALHQTQSKPGSSRQSSRGRATGRSASRGRSTADGADSMTKDELYEKAQKMDVPGRSKMGKKELAKAVQSKS